jgi:hypothetical protein
MSNELTRNENAMTLSPENLVNAMAAMNSGGTNSMLVLNLPSKTGKWTIGRDQEAVPAGARVVMDPASIQMGFVAWYGGKSIASAMESIMSGRVAEPPVVDNEGEPLPTGTDPKGEPLCKVSPQYQVTVTLEGSGGLKAIIRGGSVGFKFALEDVLQKIVLRARAGETRLSPVVELAVGSYVNAYGKQYPPKFNVVNWM